MRQKILLILISSMAASGCGSDSATTDYWAFFESGLYAESHAEFSALVASDPTEGFTGLGWTVLRMDSIARSEYYFSRILGDSTTDAHAGYAFAAWYAKHYTQSLDACAFVLRHDNQYTFPHDDRVDFRHIVLCQAYNHYATGNYAACIERIGQLDATYSAPAPSDPQAPSLLLAKLDDLGGDLFN